MRGKVSHKCQPFHPLPYFLFLYLPFQQGKASQSTRAAVPAAGSPSLSPGGQEPMEHEPGHPVPRPGGAPPASPAKGASSSPEGILASLPLGIMETVAVNG